MNRSMSSLLIEQLIEQIDVGACMPMRHRDRATANGRIHPRDPGQLVVRTAHDQPLIIGHTRTGGVVGVDGDAQPLEGRLRSPRPR